jgi:hypothetical protein
MKALTGTETLYAQGHELFLRNTQADWATLPGPMAITVHFLYAPDEHDLDHHLRDGGDVVIVVPRGASVVHQLTRMYQEMVHVPADHGALDADGLGERLDELGVPFERLDLPFTVDARACFDDGDDDGQRLLSFLCQADLVHAPAELREIMRMALEQACGGDAALGRVRLDTCAFVIGTRLAA